MRALDRQEPFGDLVQRLVPGNLAPATLALGADPPQWPRQPLGMVDALGIARHLLADDAGRVGIVLGAAHAPDGVRIDDLDVERAGRRAVVRAHGARDALGDGAVHRGKATAMRPCAQTHRRDASHEPGLWRQLDA
jgi:hypothetical protein